MNKSEIINDVLSKSLTPEILQIINESYMHSVPDGSESHFKIIIVSTKFNDLSKIARHRLVFSLLKTEFKNIHALTLSLYTPIEWENKTNPPLSSPNCAKSREK
ncbi:MAG: BolA family transcriptional regulator [Legionellaceae bacterium]|nr:BolA family transcriptional regulator [Legionellaceae bacterium]